MVIFLWTTTVNLPQLINDIKDRMKKEDIVEEVQEEEDSEGKKFKNHFKIYESQCVFQNYYFCSNFRRKVKFYYC